MAERDDVAGRLDQALEALRAEPTALPRFGNVLGAFRDALVYLVANTPPPDAEPTAEPTAVVTDHDPFSALALTETGITGATIVHQDNVNHMVRDVEPTTQNGTHVWRGTGVQLFTDTRPYTSNLCIALPLGHACTPEQAREIAAALLSAAARGELGHAHRGEQP